MSMLAYSVCILSFFLVISLYYCFKFALILLNLQDKLNDSLQIIESNYEKINSILDIPVFYDSYEVKKVVSSIEEVKNSLLIIADNMTEDIFTEEVEEDIDA